MNFDGCSPQAIPRYGSVFQWDAPVQLPLGLARIATNLRYTAQSVGSRWGFTNRLKFGVEGSKLSGFTFVRYLAENNSGTEINSIFAYTQSDGNLYAATPFVQSTVAQLSTDALVAESNLARIPGLNPVLAQAFNRGYAAMGDLTKGVGPNLVYDPNLNTLDEASDKPLGTPWVPSTVFRVGQVVSPSSFQTDGLPEDEGVWVSIAGPLFRCISTTGTGLSGTIQPIWPTTPDGIIVDNQVTWEENTPSCQAGIPDPPAVIDPTTTADASSPIVAGATVYVALTFNTSQGEGINEIVNSQGAIDPTRVLTFQNTTAGPVDLSFLLPPIPAEDGTAGPFGANGATSYNVYAYVVPGTPDITQTTDPTFYAQVAANQAPGTSVTINAFPSGVPLPTINTANVSTPGNVDVGVRWMVVFYETRTEYFTGFGATSPIQVNVTNSGQSMFAVKIPIGPYNCIRRLCAFTVAGASSAGPYFFVDEDDVESPGFNQPDIPITATTLNDNTSTTATFNITDTFLPGASEVTEYFNRIEIPPCSDIHFSKNLQCVFYTGATGFPSDFLASDLEDPEAVRIPGSNIACSESDGDRTVCVRSIRDNEIGFKENSAHAIIANSGDPNTWSVQKLWGGSGPAGAKAIDIGVDDQVEFAVYAHKSGPYRYTGSSPMLIGRELGAAVSLKIQGLWKQINWAFGYKIVVTIDSERRIARFAVPMGTATDISHTITCDYQNGWDDPVVFVVRRGIEVPNIQGRKWSLDDLAPMDSFFVPQRYMVPAPTDGEDLNSQLVLGMPDGALYTYTEGQMFDENWNGDQVGYLSQWLGVPNPNTTGKISSLEGATISANGAGLLNVYTTDADNNTYMLTNALNQVNLTANERFYALPAISEEFTRTGIGFDNGGVVGAGFEIHVSTLWTQPRYGQQIG
jgi:hypothetical protein